MRDEIADQQDAERKRDRLLLGVLIVAVIAVMGTVLYIHEQNINHKMNVDAKNSVLFLGRTLQLPPLWQVYEAGTTAETLVLNQGQSGAKQPTITVEDERQKPEDPDKFVDGWKNATRFPGFQPESIDSYHDSSVNAAGATCVQIVWGGNERPLKVVCLSSDGRFKASLSGSSRDTRALDIVVEQFRLLEN